MNISLAQAVSSVNIISKQISKLQRDLKNVAFQTINKSEALEDQEETFYDVYGKLSEAESDLIELKLVIRTVNQAETLAWDDQDVSIGKAIELSKLLRSQAKTLANYGSNRKKEAVNSYSNPEPRFQIAMFDPKAVSDQAAALERKADRLSALIEARNHSINIDLPFMEKYL